MRIQLPSGQTASRSVALSILAALAFTLPQAPSGALAQPGIVLPPTVVVGRQIEEKLSAELAEYGHQVTVLQGEDIMKQGYTDMNEALAKMVPNLIITNRGRADYNYFHMNGNTNILWLIDGVRINNRLYSGTYIDTIGIHLIERVEVLTGGEGLFYGTDSASGVVNIITRKPSPGVSGEVGAAVGTDRYYDSYATVSAGAGRHRFLAHAAYDSWEGYIPFRDRVYQLVTPRPNPDPGKRSYDRLNVALKYETEFFLEGRNSLAVSLMRNSGSFEFPSAGMHLQVNHRLEHIGMLKWDHDVSDRYSYYVKAYFHSWWNKYDIQNINHTMAYDKSIWGFEDWGINFLNSIRFEGGHELLLGYDYQNYWARYDASTVAPAHEQVHAFFFQFRPRFAFWEGLNLALGARYNLSDAGDSFIWNVSAKIPVLDGDRLFVRANIGTSFILPTANELFRDQPFAAQPSYGNPNLKPQRSFSATLGLVSKGEFLDFDIGVFYERVTDKILLDSRRVYQNTPGRTEVGGFAVSVAARPADGLTLSSTFIRQGARLTDPQGARTRRMADQPQEYLKLGVQYDADLGSGQKFGIGVYSTWMGRVYDEIAALGNDRWQNYGNYWLTDVNLYYRPAEGVRVTLSLANVFDTDYAPWGLARYTDPQSPKGYSLFESPLGAPFSATLGVSYSF